MKISFETTGIWEWTAEFVDDSGEPVPNMPMGSGSTPALAQEHLFERIEEIWCIKRD